MSKSIKLIAVLGLALAAAACAKEEAVVVEDVTVAPASAGKY